MRRGRARRRTSLRGLRLLALCPVSYTHLFAHALEPMKRSLVLVRPVKGVSTAEAYRMFHEAPLPIDEGCLQQAKQAACASDVPLYNNLASASERLMPELDEVKAWLQSQPGVEGVLLCGSGSTTFAVVNGCLLYTS